MRSATWLILALSLILAAPAAAQGRGSRTIRFAAMDRNNDGVITRDEWRGSERSFRNHDWNGDGRLSGDEVRPGAARRERWDDRDINDAIDRDDDFTPARFRTLDHDRDGRLARGEYHGPAEFFSRLDRDRDGFLTVAEFTGTDIDREDRFADLDGNGDGRVSRDEWHGAPAVFDALDANRDGSLTREEALGTETGGRDPFRSIDVNGDNAIARSEWHWNSAAFDRLDTNRDRRLTRAEFEATPEVDLSRVSAAYRAGYERGRQEGIQAGREDKPARGWDLEGQRELETADSGWEPRHGHRGEYQDGYRAGFRRGYAEGFGPRR
jgi:Ca2+-binding EF-hand superfamily protein